MQLAATSGWDCSLCLSPMLCHSPSAGLWCPGPSQQGLERLQLPVPLLHMAGDLESTDPSPLLPF